MTEVDVEKLHNFVEDISHDINHGIGSGEYDDKDTYVLTNEQVKKAEKHGFSKMMLAEEVKRKIGQVILFNPERFVRD